MGNQKAAVEVKQEGDFKIKSKPKRKAKDLGHVTNAPAKIDLTVPEATGEIVPNVAKMDLTKKPKEDAIPESKTTGLSDDKRAEGLQQVDEGVRSVQEQKPDTDVKVDAPLEEVIEEIIETDEVEVKKEDKPQLIETPSLPENVEKLVSFMNETGGTVEDYVELNKDYSKLDNDQVLKEYLRKNKPHLDKDDIDLIMEDYKIDEDLDEEKEIRK